MPGGGGGHRAGHRGGSHVAQGRQLAGTHRAGSPVGSSRGLASVHGITGPFRQDHAGATRGPTGGHRQRRDLPVSGRVLLFDRASHRRQWRSQDMTDARIDGPLLAPLTADQWGDDENAAFGALLGLPREKVPRAGSGHPADPLRFDIIGLLARHPKMARKFLTSNGWLLQRGELPLRLRELAVLRVAHTRRSAFFWGGAHQGRHRGWGTRGRHFAACRGQRRFHRYRQVGARGGRRTAGPRSRRRLDVATPDRGPRHTSGDGTHLRRRNLRLAGDGVRHLAPGRARRQCASTRTSQELKSVCLLGSSAAGNCVMLYVLKLRAQSRHAELR